MPCEGPLSPSINGDSDSPLPYNGTCSLSGSLFEPAHRPPPTTFTFVVVLLKRAPYFPPPELPTPLKKRRLSPLDACMSESSTPYGSPCATPTRAEQPETPATPILTATPPRPRAEEQSSEPSPCTPVQTHNAPLEVSLSACQWLLMGFLIRALVTRDVAGFTERIFSGKFLREPETQRARG